jgi:hypothetical protein
MFASLVLLPLCALGASPEPPDDQVDDHAAQVAPEPQPEAAPKPRTLPRLEPGAPVLSWARATSCLDRGDGLHWRAQCDLKSRVCLVAPDVELDSDLAPRGKLDRSQFCVPQLSEAKLRAEGYRFIDAVAEAPPGWRRDARGRVMQTSFDMNRRLWLGGGYLIPWGKGPGLGWATVSLGFRGEWLVGDDEAPSLVRLSLFNGDAAVNASALEATTLQIDTSRGGTTPGLRLTTFVGTPRRFDVDLSVGFWSEVLSIELHDVGARHHARLGFGAIGGTLDLWHSRDLASYVRLRADAGFEEDRTTRVCNVTPTGAAEADITLGESGLHHVRALAQYERVIPLAAGGVSANRVRFRLGYEVGLVAINDQPLSALIEGRADQRGDLPDQPETWEYQGLASLRFSFWVPTRRGARAQTTL